MADNKIELTEQQLKEEAFECDRLLRRNVLESFLLLKNMYDKQLHKFLGFETLEEYCLEAFGWAKTTMYIYLNIAAKFPQISPDSDKFQHAGIYAIGAYKLDILTKLDFEQRQELQETGEIDLNDKIYSIEDF